MGKKNPEEAESLKREWGLSRAPENRELFSVLVPPLSALKDEMLQRIEYWRTKQGKENPITRILLTGRASNLSGFPEYLSSGIGIPVYRANVWRNILSLDEVIPAIPFDESLGYSTALGLALADITL